MFIEETVIPGGYGGDFVAVDTMPAYGLGGFGMPMCCPAPICCLPLCSPCCYGTVML